MPFSNGSLFVRKAKKSYEDSYYCTAVNSGGYEFEDVDVKVGGKDICKPELLRGYPAVESEAPQGCQ